MSFKTNSLLAGAMLLALGACGGTGNSWEQEAGAQLDEGGFGNPTMNNMLAQMCRGQAKGFVPSDPVVALDPKGSAGAPVYRRGKVLCSGNLNGQYAQIIWDEYVESATAPTIIEGGVGAIEGE